MQALVVLAGAGHVSLVQTGTKQTRPQCAALNRYLCERARGSAEIAFLASLVTGGVVVVPRLEQVFMLPQSPGKRSARDLAKFVWDVLKQQGQMMKKDGKALQTEAENLEELAKLGEIFLKRLPILEALEIDQILRELGRVQNLLRKPLLTIVNSSMKYRFLLSLCHHIIPGTLRTDRESARPCLRSWKRMRGTRMDVSVARPLNS